MEHELKMNFLSLASHTHQPDWGSSGSSGAISIAPLAQSDVDAMVEMIKENLNPFEEAGSVLAAAHRRLQNFYEVYTAPGSVYITIKDTSKTQLIGGAGLGPFAGLNPAEGIGEIRELVIDPPFRGKGFGAQLIQSCLFWAEKFSYRRLYLETTPQMEHAQQLFRRFQFKPVTLQTAGGNGESDQQQLPCYFMLER
ncbi:MAG: GNAT family N-acetyltransferase [Oligoflexus sp.]